MLVGAEDMPPRYGGGLVVPGTETHSSGSSSSGGGGGGGGLGRLARLLTKEPRGEGGDNYRRRTHSLER